ncbi:armadillo-type protein [Dichotomopilus funicola]|uniref:Armadillo-type protein n=1 Tax=Dichotomopilus funicola TaxID=1934379 RepID=A0AAN6VCH0_9PEZI|nr:armadillo-type protein [Dichotomopilus funicola]
MQQQQQQQNGFPLLAPAPIIESRQRSKSKSSVLRSLVGGGGHKRNNSDGTALPAAPLISPIMATPAFHMSQQNLAHGNSNRDSSSSHSNGGVFHVGFDAAAAAAMEPQRYAHALGELQQNRKHHNINSNDRSPERRGRRERAGSHLQQAALPPPSSPTKTGGFSTISLRPFGRGDRDTSKPPKTRDNSPTKPKKAKSATNLASLLRPKSMKNLKQLLTDDSKDKEKDKDKENRSPSDSSGVPTTPASAGAVAAAGGAMPGYPPTPIYAQFSSQHFPRHGSSVDLPIGSGTGMVAAAVAAADRAAAAAAAAASGPTSSGPDSSFRKKPRPKSFQPYIMRKRSDDSSKTAGSGVGVGGGRESNSNNSSSNRAKRLTWGKGNSSSTAANGSANAASRPGIGSRGVSAMTPAEGPGGDLSQTPAQQAIQLPVIDPKDIDKHLEAMLDRRNIPENQRYKMRNLSDTIKMEFIRQDWAEMQAKMMGRSAGERPSSHDGHMQLGAAAVNGFDQQQAQQQDEQGDTAAPKKDKKKHGRGLSLTIVRGSNKSNGTPSSPTKKQKNNDGHTTSLGRHFRSKSTESLVSNGDGTIAPSSPFPSGYGSSFLAKVKGQQLPGDFVAYLQKVQRPELVEVGKLHKLRLLLRNETVAWTEEFIRLGGMEEMVELLHRIMAVEWREEHEDALLHETLLCLKALCTTDMALQYLHSIHTTLFPALLHMIFDPEKKGPSEFTTRGIITSLLLTYIECATPLERVARAKAVLGFLRDPEPKEEDRPVDFVLEMRRDRPYRVWCKEVVNVTKEVFWIFLHNLNIVALPADNNNINNIKTDGTTTPATSGSTTTPSTADSDSFTYMTRHFPQERPPVPAAPYVGGVEWDATNYLASHLDLLNAILACTGPTAAERNALRADLRISGWERCLGGSLRLCKEKFYGGVHDGLRRWVAAGVEDGWCVRDVRYGPPPPEGGAKSRGQSPVKKTAANGNGGGEAVAPPRIEMPRFDFGGPVAGAGSGGVRPNEPWLG